ncbi:MAG: hypothetical protein IJ164_05945 [Duodenibacillus sp.]|nr:hypothetical protein [Duodenibacillus sp.]
MKATLTAALVAASLAVSGSAFAFGSPKPAPERIIAIHGTHSLEQIGQTVTMAAALRKFAVESKRPGRIQLAYPANPRKFQAHFEVVFDQHRLAMRYLNSFGLNEAPCKDVPSVKCVHPNVARWMRNHIADVENMLK